VAQLQVQPSTTKLSKEFYEHACDCLDKFSLDRWLSKTGDRFSFMPHTSYIPYQFQHLILTHFCLIHTYAQFSSLLSRWEDLDNDGPDLFASISKLNKEFDNIRQQRKAAANLKAAETRHKKAAVQLACTFLPHPTELQLTSLIMLCQPPSLYQLHQLCLLLWLDPQVLQSQWILTLS
jgi:hypothetical protein